MLQSMKLRSTDQQLTTDAGGISATSSSNGLMVVDNAGHNTTTTGLNSTMYTNTNNNNNNNSSSNSSSNNNNSIITNTLPAPVAQVTAAAHANGLAGIVYCNNSNIGSIPGINGLDTNSGISNNNNKHMMVNNNHLNNRQQQQQQQQHLQQYQAMYLENAMSVAETTANAVAVAAAGVGGTLLSNKIATSKTFHPYTRPPPQTVSSSSASSLSSPTVAALSTALSLSPPQRLQSFVYSNANAKQINSTNTNVKTSVSSSHVSSMVGGGVGAVGSGVNMATSHSSSPASSGLLTLPTSPPVATVVAASIAGVSNSQSPPTATLLANNNNNNSMDQQQQPKHHQQQQQQQQSSETNPNTTMTTGNGNASSCESNMENEITNEMSSSNENLAIVPFTPMECSTNMGTTDEFSKEQPDADTIKMFVGQVPKAWDEIKLRALFEQYGRVHTLNVLRDKVTMMSRGCCFVTYYTRKAALRAQDALHNIRTLDGMHHPIQMKPADSENRNERKLFVGMLNKKYNEADVRQLFTGHGTIEECTVLRDQNGQSKGCAFVTFDTKQHAIGAIKALHHSQTMEGCSAPLVVKFADTQKEKDQKKFQQLQVGLCGITALTTPTAAPRPVLGALAAAPAVPATALSSATQLVSTPVAASVAGTRTQHTMASLAAMSAAPATLPTAGGATAAALIPTSTASMFVPSPTSATQQTSPYLTTADGMLPNSAAAAAQMQIFQQLQAYGLQPTHYLQGLNFPPDHSTTAAATISANNAAAAAAANAAAAAAAATNTNGSGNGLLATSISMQNLVTLASMNQVGTGAQQYTSPYGSQTGGHYAVPTSKALTSVSTIPQGHGMAGQYSTSATPPQHHLVHHPQQPQVQQQHQQTSQQLLHHHPYHATMAVATGPTALPSYAAHLASGTAGTTLYALTSQYAPALNPLTNGAYAAAAAAPLAASALQAAAAGVAGKQIEGPEGSNLFIYHLPQEFNDTDLASTFLPFGNVLSAKVFIDKQTNLSKCFGFVSYDNPHSAGAAIQAMHGFQIGTKRLKVQLKRSKDAAKPY
ncbi:uncharacterized protein LOC142226767 isoform X2 [Haematobia irritans]|uniref:uncharacterized protein LOC142226767 isoform X2 n=1 Tax=Haematobia irritans TaxID=7368 RepID=UPI003F504649